MKVTSIVLFGSAIASHLVAAETGTSTLRKQRRDLLKTLYARQEYPIGSQPSCIAGYDAQPTSAAGSCGCGPGREPSGDLCVTPASAGSYNTFTLTGPVQPPFAVSSTTRYTAAASIMTADLCASIAVQLQSVGSRGFYLQASATAGENDCWVLGDETSNSSVFFAPSATGLPFTPAVSVAKRALAQDGAVGQPGGIIGFEGAAPGAGPGAATCETSLGDVPNANGTCDCGDNRVSANPPENTLCRSLTASAAARLRRRQAAAHF